MAPGPDGSLYVWIPRAGGSVLALLDRSGAARPGWPITLKDATQCRPLLPVADGSVRVICTLEGRGDMYAPIGAFAVDSIGSPIAGWPVELAADGYLAGRVIGEDLTIQAWDAGNDVDEGTGATAKSWIMTIAADGTVRNGVKTSLLSNCCSEIGPDRVAFAASSDAAGTKSKLEALGATGAMSGFPVAIDGATTGPAVGPDGRIVVVVGAIIRRTSQVLVFDQAGNAASDRSSELAMETAEGLGVDCGSQTPPPIVSGDGSIFVTSWLDDSIFGLDRSLDVMPGWPFEPATPLERPSPFADQEGLNCSSLARAAAGPDSTLYLPLMARNTKVGGSLVAVSTDGSVRPGWPVEIKRPGSQFWSVVVGPDGTAYALAIEPEAGGKSSASILAIAPDSTVQWTTTIIDP